MGMVRATKSAGPANEVRIIGGAHRRRLLRFPSEFGLRPTPDRVRETLFNWLGQDLAGFRVLDAFAGSGALGFEAASRNAAKVVMLDANPRVIKVLETNRDLIGLAQVEIVQADAAGWLSRHEGRYDLIFLDPPFGSNLMPKALPLAIARLAEGGWIYMEQGEPPSAPEGFIIHRSGAAGASHYCLLKRG
jgi:16S rRNA (guanine966-N2)-methyltransferase